MTLLPMPEGVTSVNTTLPPDKTSTADSMVPSPDRTKVNTGRISPTVLVKYPELPKKVVVTTGGVLTLYVVRLPSPKGVTAKFHTGFISSGLVSLITIFYFNQYSQIFL